MGLAVSTNSGNAVHFVVLVHGLMGSDLELKYLQETLTKNFNDEDDIPMVVYSSNTNVGKTFDGIAAGGTRLAKEVMDKVEGYKCQGGEKVFLSFVGNSLGGLYARYALSLLNWDQIVPCVFCTTATPHLGVSKHTYVPIPRSVEWVTANLMQPTGKDLFRYSTVLEEMTFMDAFIEPLERFHKRIAYANAFWTDFQVPTTTGAFLSSSSSYPHITIEDPTPFVALRVETPKASKREPTTDWSTSLDMLGWTKVFCDVRDGIPLPSIPLMFGQDVLSKPSFQSRGTWTSKDLIPAMTSFGGRWHLPLGHAVMVANAKSEWYAVMNSKGKPVMDKLAAELIADMRACQQLDTKRLPNKTRKNTQQPSSQQQECSNDSI
eukprot:CAMPEP_0118704632 /NCGR_PEP_ID=MMETSP0800-20121206/19350_1 /TAXON_ID=210618 ORGANISM="Striatella unipunctata, Strain CCMP2910" /NCGR_SAMPLE_ID=MMETSP0800 /ASSEMBLY_ACC=CAM_ASM_000638 /LENGTH=376 /DNA_ID=CAMNT_0006606557 /DNA_START=34 /DNA_END=1164 /DNA_ORIENTATION=-